MNDDFNKWIELYYNSKWDHTWFSLNNTQTAWLQSTKFTVDNVIKFEDINTGIKEGIMNWREEYKKMKKLSLREMELLKNGPDSLASSWRLQSMYNNWKRIKGISDDNT